MRNYFISVTRAKIKKMLKKKKDEMSVPEDAVKREPLCTVDVNINW